MVERPYGTRPVSRARRSARAIFTLALISSIGIGSPITERISCSTGAAIYSEDKLQQVILSFLEHLNTSVFGFGLSSTSHHVRQRSGRSTPTKGRLRYRSAKSIP